MAGRIQDPVVAAPAPEPSDYDRLLRFLLWPEHRFGLAIVRCNDARVATGVRASAEIAVKSAHVGVVEVNAADIGRNGDIVEHLVAAC